MVTEKLKDEHQLILRWIDWMERIASDDARSSANAENTLLMAHAGIIVDFIRNYADAYHHSKEEDVLFRYLALPGTLTECNPLPVMMSEHQSARAILRQFQFAASLNDVNDMIEQVRRYASLLRQHIFKEDNILYRMAEQGLDESAKQRILAEYAAIDEAPQNSEMERRYRNFLDSFG